MYLTTTQAAEIHGVTKQAIFVAIRKKRLKAEKVDSTHWLIKCNDLAEYQNDLYTRRYLKRNGELIYDIKKGLISVKDASEMLDVPVGKIYHAIRTGKIKYQRKSISYILHCDDVIDYANKYLNYSILVNNE